MWYNENHPRYYGSFRFFVSGGGREVVPAEPDDHIEGQRGLLDRENLSVVHGRLRVLCRLVRVCMGEDCTTVHVVHVCLSVALSRVWSCCCRTRSLSLSL